jgi:hypothetical protein
MPLAICIAALGMLYNVILFFYRPLHVYLRARPLSHSEAGPTPGPLCLNFTQPLRFIFTLASICDLPGLAFLLSPSGACVHRSN